MKPRVIGIDELPRSQKSLAKLADENDWTWRCDFVEPDSYVLRFIRYWRPDGTWEQRAVAYWSGGKFQGAYRGNPRTRLKAAELKEYLKS